MKSERRPYAYEQIIFDEKNKREISRRLFYAREVEPIDAYKENVSFIPLYADSVMSLWNAGRK